MKPIFKVQVHFIESEIICEYNVDGIPAENNGLLSFYISQTAMPSIPNKMLIYDFKSPNDHNIDNEKLKEPHYSKLKAKSLDKNHEGFFEVEIRKIE